MFETPYISKQSLVMSSRQPQSRSQQMTEHAAHAFQSAFSSGRLARFFARLMGKTNQLADLETFIAGQTINERHYARTRTVLLSQIRGSESRSCDYDINFHPMAAHDRSRWMSVMLARLQGICLPAVELIQIGDTYFVRDGHHRISVAKVLGEEAIDAEITLIQLASTTASQTVAASAQTGWRKAHAAH